MDRVLTELRSRYWRAKHVRGLQSTTLGGRRLSLRPLYREPEAHGFPISLVPTPTGVLSVLVLYIGVMFSSKLGGFTHDGVLTCQLGACPWLTDHRACVDLSDHRASACSERRHGLSRRRVVVCASLWKRGECAVVNMTHAVLLGPGKRSS